MKNKITSNLIFLASLLFLNVLHPFLLKSQEPIFKLFEIRSETSKPRMLNLLKDHDGIFWIGTDQGIYRFDGIEFRNVFDYDTSENSQAKVSSLFEDHARTIWAGFDDGKIAAIRNDHGEWLNIPGGNLKTNISAFQEDSSGRLFISTQGQGVFYLEKNQLHQINHENGLSDDFCYSLLLLPDGRMCTGTDRGLDFIRINAGNPEVTSFTSQNGLPDNIVRCLSLGKDGTLWIGMQDKGICKFIPGKENIERSNETEWQYGQVNSIIALHHETWIATEENGIIVEESQGQHHPLLKSSNPFYFSKVHELQMDDEQNVWILSGTHLLRTTGEKLRELTTGEPELKLNFIHCILADKHGDLWFSPDQDLYKAHRQPDGNFTFKKFDIPGTGTSIDIVTLFEDDYGFLWVGTMGEGVFRLNMQTGKTTKIKGEEAFNNGSILSIHGKGNSIWIGGFNGISKCEINSDGNLDKLNYTFPKIKALEQLYGNYIYTVRVDSKNRIWFGTDGKGAALLDQDHLQFFTIENGLPGNTIHTITEDKNGRIWLGIDDGGISAYDGQNFINYSVKEGLTDPDPTSITCDNSGNIVIAYNDGIEILNPDNGISYNYSEEYGLNEIEPDLNSITQDQEGSIWIGSTKGIFQYRPVSKGSRIQPEIKLTGVSVFLQQVNFSNRSVFSHDENNIRFEFAGIWYSDPERITYNYFLDGYDSKWQETRDRAITFPKLPPGNYTFHVRAAFRNNFEKAPEATYVFIINTPFWKRTWFLAILAAIISAFIFSIIKRREIRLRKVGQLEKEKIEFQFETLRSQVNPHFLFNSFNTLISVIEDNPKTAVEYVERLSEFFRNIVTNHDKDLIVLKEELSLLDDYLFIQRKRYGNSLLVNINIDDSFQKQQLIPPLTLQLLAENAIKHNAVSKETPLSIELFVKDGYLFLRNNINLKYDKSLSTGLGLQNILNRYKLLTTREVIINPSVGFFTVAVPLITEKKNEHTDHRR